MANFYHDNDDLQFYIEQGIDWKTLVELVELGFRAPDAPAGVDDAVDTYKEVLDLAGQFAADEIAPRAAAMDATGVHMDADGHVKASPEHDAIFRQLGEIGLYGVCVPRELGGMGAPSLLYLQICELFARADVSTMAHFGFHTATAMALLLYSIREGTTEVDELGRIVATRWEKAIRACVSGEQWGSMDLTEPDAGSDLAALRTRAAKDADGVWHVTGNKIFITSGHGQYHFVLAKTADEASLDALSLFMVPLTLEKDGQTIQNARVDRVEEKVGHHGSPTCSVQFDESEAELVGKVGEGFKNMLFLMNHARLGVGFESIGVCEAAYRTAKAYAAERKTMGKPIDQHPMIYDYLDEMDVTIRGLRAMAMEAAILDEVAVRLENGERARLAHHKVSDAETRRRIKLTKRQVRFLTPLLKYAASEAAVAMARRAMQILGGNGYMRDYPAERIMRDSLVLPVYEGTSQIQALMALKDNLQAILRNPQRFLRKMARAKLGAVRATDPLERSLHRMESLSYSAQRHIMLRIAKNKWSEAVAGPLPKLFDTFLHDWDPKRDFSYGLLHAEHLIRILADVAMAKILVRQAEQFPERRDVAERFVERAMPRVRHNWDLIVGTGERLLGQLADTTHEAPASKIA